MSKGTLHRPPKWADRFLEWYCDKQLVNEVQGDLHEMYHLRVEKSGRFRAQFLFIWEVIRSFKPANIKKSDRYKNLNYFDMFKNNYIISVRNLMKHKFYSSIKILGLAIGLASVILISSFVYNEMTFDQFHEDADRIYRFSEIFSNEQGVVEEKSASIPFPFGPTFHVDYPDVETVRLYQTFQKTPLVVYRDGEKSFYEEKLFFTDSTFFNIFSFELAQGNPATALDNPRSLVITESMAKKYFGDEPAMGKTVYFENKLPLTVTAIAKDPPLNSHFRFEFLSTLMNIDEVFEATGNRFGANGWYWNPCHTYAKVPQGMSQAQLQQMVVDFIPKHFSSRMAPWLEFPLQKLTDIHLTSQLYQEIEPNRDYKSIYIAVAIAVFIIIIAVINFMNLSAARSSQRAKEVAVRKVMGSNKRQLIDQFLMESLLTSIISLIIAIGMVTVLISPFEQITNAPLNFEILLNPIFILIIFSFSFIIGLLAGLYPAFIVSSFKPVDALKIGNIKLSGKKSPWIWKGLVVFQFATSIILVIGAIIVNQQHNFLLNKDLGFEKEQVVMVPIRGTSVKQRSDEFKAELLKQSSIISASAMSDILGNDVPLRPFLFEGQQEAQNLPGLFADFDFIKTFGLKILEGRDFSHDLETDRETFIINESAAQAWENGDWEGKRIGWARKGRPVIGVVEDFHFADLKQTIRPFVITYSPGWYAYMAIRVRPENIFSSVQSVEEVWNQFEPDRPFTPFFLDERLNNIYESERKISQMVGYFSIISIFLASLGLLGLTNYATLLRVKEIGVRKVLGASVPAILRLLSKDYAILILVANLLAWPAAWYFSQEWLANFTFKIDLSIWTFVIAGFATLTLSVMTICFQGLKTALLNPSESLRSE
ncbi:MAG: FtsX-like permease family protein [Roseivirga sp.]|nr:FtsX-like permease family protein [Roseivirga sp.]